MGRSYFDPEWWEQYANVEQAREAAKTLGVVLGTHGSLHQMLGKADPDGSVSWRLFDEIRRQRWERMGFVTIERDGRRVTMAPDQANAHLDRMAKVKAGKLNPPKGFSTPQGSREIFASRLGKGHTVRPCTYKGEPWGWTDNHMAVMGEPPRPVDGEPVPLDQIVPSPSTWLRAEYLGMCGEEAWAQGQMLSAYRAGDHVEGYDVGLTQHLPKGEAYLIPHSHMLLVAVKGEPVGCVMPLRGADEVVKRSGLVEQIALPLAA